MKISEGMSLISGIGSPQQVTDLQKAGKENSISFSDTLTGAINDVNNMQGQAGKAVEQLVSGGATDIHDVMIAVEKAKTSFDLLMEIRNKSIDVYREMMRMQV